MAPFKFFKHLFTGSLLFTMTSFFPISLSAQINEALIGTWAGRLEQSGYGSYDVEMTIATLVIDSTSGVTTYPAFPCFASNTFLGNVDSLHIFSETIINGFCIDGRTEVYLLNDNKLQFNWYMVNGSTIEVAGELRREVTTNSGDVTEHPDNFRLSEIYPNPGIGNAEFTLELAQREDVDISLINLSGAQVVSLFQGTLQPQKKHSFTIDGSLLTAGLYLLSVTSPQFRTSKMIVRLE